MTGRSFVFLILATFALRLDAQAQEVAPDSVASRDMSATTMVAADSATGDSANTLTASPSAPDSIARTRMLVVPVQDSKGGMPILRGMLGETFIDQIVHDTLPHGAVVSLADSIQVPTEQMADSLGRANRAARVVWMTLHGSTDSGFSIRAQLRESYSDSLVREFEVALPDTAELALAVTPRALLLGVFPRALPPPPTLQDSIKMVAILPFLSEGTAGEHHALKFGDDLAAQLQGRDGFRVLPKVLRDSLLGSWDPGECLTASCRLEAGQRLGVAWIIAGRLTQLGEKWTVVAELVRADSSALGRSARAQCLGAPAPSLNLVTGITVRQLAGVESPRSELSDAPIARQPAGPVWRRLVVLGVASVLGLVGVILSW